MQNENMDYVANIQNYGGLQLIMGLFSTLTLIDWSVNQRFRPRKMSNVAKRHIILEQEVSFIMKLPTGYY